MPQRKEARRARNEKGYEGKSEKKESKETKKESGVSVQLRVRCVCAVKACLLLRVSIFLSGDSAVSQVFCKGLGVSVFLAAPFLLTRPFQAARS